MHNAFQLGEVEPHLFQIGGGKKNLPFDRLTFFSGTALNTYVCTVKKPIN